jgi:formate/nitrite transporter FocA (FNT family)
VADDSSADRSQQPPAHPKSGLTIGFSFLLGAFTQTLVPDRYAHAASGAVYPIGFAFVIFA